MSDLFNDNGTEKKDVAPQEKERLTTWQVIRNKFPENEYVLIQEVSDQSGFSRTRSLDYMLINLWQSRGLAITGIEVKSFRNDWLRELKNPKKQENHFKYCDYFYLLTDSPDVAKMEEIPISWGWYHINDKQILKTIKAAPKQNPVPVDRSFLCAMLRRAASKQNYVHIDSLESRIKEQAEAIQKDTEWNIRRQLQEYEDLKKNVKEFSAASGINLSLAHQFGYYKGMEKIGIAVKYILDHGVDDYVKRMLKLENDSRFLFESVQKTIANFKKDYEPGPPELNEDET